MHDGAAGFNAPAESWVLSITEDLSLYHSGSGLFGSGTDTGLDINLGETYLIQVEADPANAQVRYVVDNLDSAQTTFDSGFVGTLGSATSVGNALAFNSRVLQGALDPDGDPQTDDTILPGVVAYSMDSVSVAVPEPASLGLLALGGMVVLGGRRRRRAARAA